LAFGLLINGEMAPAEGWQARAARLLEDQDDCAERGYLLLPEAIGAMFAGDEPTATALSGQAAEIGERFGDANVVAFARLVEGQARAVAGEVEIGLALLDEAMVAVTSDEVSPIMSGLAYCATIVTCRDCFDVRRAREWTAALSRWCATQPDLVTFRGQCLVHRSEIKQLHGDWADARVEAQRACDRLGDPPGEMLGMALYQQGELYRLSGEHAEAEQAYRKASEWGHEPQPGRALLRLAQGQPAAAAAALRVILDEPRDLPTRARMLAASTEVLLATGDVAGARNAAGELAHIAATVGAPLLLAVSDHASAQVLLADGDARGALDRLRRAASAWRELDAPYEVARVRVLVAAACHALGDYDTATLELEAARLTFERVGAMPDLQRLDATTRDPAKGTSGLTAREIEVLRLIARGKTNRDIAGDLVISEHTVARHVQNIFTKAGVSSRSAATAFAFEHDLV